MAEHLNLWLGGLAFPLGLATGAILFRADYCLAGMFRDYFLFRHTFMLRTLLLLVTASMVLFEVLRLAGLLRPYPFPGLTPPALTTLLGGFVFGLGMVLAGGCVFGTLYRMGRGSRGAWLAFAGLLLGSGLYAEIHPFWLAATQATRLAPALTLSQLLGLAPTPVVAGFGLFAGSVLWRWQRQGLLRREIPAVGGLQPSAAALLLALLGAGSWLLLGMPLGLTTAATKAAALAGSWLWPGHLATLSYFQGEPLVFRPPLAAAAVAAGAGPRLDILAAIQVPLAGGIILGSFLCAWRYGDLIRGGRLPPRQALSALLGGLLMGLAARMAPGCNVWHLLGGLPILALSSLLFVAGLVPGAWLGSRLLPFLLRQPAISRPGGSP